MAGELHIGGINLARGYWNRPELTAERFISNPFSSIPGMRLYKTGDWARYLPDGNIEFLGRIDHQVKIRGFRIELGEIEIILSQHSAVQEAVVIVREDRSGDKRLVAYVVTNQNHSQLTMELSNFLKMKLPDYMIPSAFVVLAALPLTPSGKVNRRALPIPEVIRPELRENFIAARNPIEEMIAAIWARVLGLENIGINDNFFELGGHSLLATQIISRVREAFNLEIPLRSLFESPTVAGLAKRVEQSLGREQNQWTIPIPIISRTGELPLSFAQQRLWFFSQLESNNSFYNLPGVLRLIGLLNVAALQESINEIVRRHESLRTSFQTINGRPVQVIAPTMDLTLEVIDLTESSEAEQEVLRLASDEAQSGFDLSQSPLLRVKLLRLDKEKHALLFTMHHIISDGWSIAILTREISLLYQAYIHGQLSPLPALPIQYADYAYWQREWLQGEVLENQLGYWRKQLADISTLQLSTDHPRPPIQSYRGDYQQVRLSRSMTAALDALSRQAGTTLFMTLLAAFNCLLYRYSGQKDIAIGTPIANRNRAEIEELIGFFVNTLVLRTQVSGDITFLSLLKRVREVALAAYANQDLPFEKLVEELQPTRDMSRSPLFQVMMALQNTPMVSLALTDLIIEPYEVEVSVTKFDLTLTMAETTEGLTGIVGYNTDLYESITISRMIAHFENLLTAALDNPQQTISSLPLLSETERHQLLVEWNNTTVEYPYNKCIHQLFEEQVAQTPLAIAVVYEQEQLSYQEINRRANQLAHYLISLGVGPEVLVGICLERSIEMVVAIMGVLKAGGAYLPIDPSYPLERITYILENARVLLVLTRLRRADELSKNLAEIVCLDSEWSIISAESDTNPITNVNPDNLAYVIYTSGSTGKPKGVEVSHRNLVHSTYARSLYYQDMAVRYLLLPSFAFDSSVAVIFGTLSQGSTLLLLNEAYCKDPAQVQQSIIKYQASHLLTVPSFYSYLLAEFCKQPPLCLRSAIVAGEPCSEALVATHFEIIAEVALINEYGPTEGTVWSTVYKCTTDSHRVKVPIGRPIANTQAFILDEKLEPTPVGVAGELYIGGAGLARGYLKRADLTAERFIPNPFSVEAGTKLYRTGDLARYLVDGNIEYLGRCDNQVKIRGYRIELAEIEAALMEHSAVQQVSVIAHQGQDSTLSLVAYLVQDTSYLNHYQPSDEVSLVTQHMTQFQTVYDQLYSQEQAFSMFETGINLNVWTSSYTRQPLTEKEILECVEDSVTRILALHPQRVLEIGCGTGLLLLRIAPQCQRYYGMDISAVVLRYLQQQLDTQVEKYCSVTLMQGMAHELASLKDEQFDTIIINEVIQHFPDIDYLVRLLMDAVGLLKKGGNIFIGGVRNLSLLSAFHTSVQLYRVPASISCRQLQQRVQESIAQEKDLIINPNFFTALPLHIPQITQVQIQLKGGHTPNEITKFKYDVVLSVNGKAMESVTVPWLDWQSEQLTLIRLQQLLMDNGREILGVRGVPNARVLKELQALTLLECENGPATAGELTNAMQEIGDGLDPEQMWTMGREYGYQVEVRWSERKECFDVLFVSSSIAVSIWPKLDIEKTESEIKQSWRWYANNPSRSVSSRVLSGQLREYLKQKLPDYMLPSTFVILDKMPLTPNGKIDHRALPAPEQHITTLMTDYRAARTPVEEVLVDIWAQVLSIKQPGITDDFFELGGHSLLATQVISRIKESFKVELELRVLFEASTIITLAEQIEAALRAEQGLELLPIVPISRDKELPLSFAQQRLWFLDQLEPNNPFYNVPAVIRLIGPLNTITLEQCINEIIKRHEVLRTSFINEDGRAVQAISAQLRVKLAEIALSHLGEEERELEVVKLINKETVRPFQLSQPPLLRIKLLRLAAAEHVLVVVMHHIISDGWSMAIFIREVTGLYEALCRGESLRLTELSIQYADYAYWQRQWLQGEVLEKQLEYWRKQLTDISTLQLPTDHPRPPVQSYRGDYQQVRLSKSMTAALNALSRQAGATLFMTLLAAFNSLLYRYSNQQDIVVGTDIANRNHAGIEELMGFFVNQLTMRTMVNGRTSFYQLMMQVREVALAAYAHQDLPFDKLVEELNPKRDLSRTPLFQVKLILHNTPQEELALREMVLIPIPVSNNVAKYDVTLSLVESREGLVGTIEYSTDLYESITISRMIAHFENLLTAALDNPQQTISSLTLLSEAERHQLLVEWNNTAVEYPYNKCIHQLFEEQVAQTPLAIAVVYEQEQLSYQEINRRANQLAHYLISLGVGPEVLVGICLERSIEMVVAIMGVLKAGGAYLPIDPSYPLERITYILENARVPLILTEEQRADELPLYLAQIVCLDSEWSIISAESDSGPISSVSPNNLAYVIYTSGSTGKPKGVMIAHHSVVNYLAWCCQTYPVQSGQAIPLHSSLSFDLTVTSLLLPLITGQQIVVVRTEEGLTGLKEALSKQSNFSLVKLTPAHLDMLNQQLLATEMIDATRALVIGGEALLAESLTNWRKHSPQTNIFNEYGPTEATVGCSVYQVMAEDNSSGVVSIGRPIANTQLYILDEYHQAVPIGVIGELYIGGVGLAQGYLNQPDLTAERFIPNPYGRESGTRLYRTGDLARYIADGNIEYLGRRDNQVKIKGYRIELAEIEAALMGHHAVSESVVIAREDRPGDKRLVAYIVGKQAETVSISDLRVYLKRKLPEYMIPAAFVVLDRLPLTPNGKVDRQTLPAPEQHLTAQTETYTAPRNNIEMALANIWTQVLGIEQVGVHDNFFELGGDSILSIQIVSRANQVGINFATKHMFQHQTIAELATVAQDGLVVVAEQGLVSGPLPLTPIQQWFFEQEFIDVHHWNQAILLTVKVKLEYELLAQAIHQLLLHHDTLRLRFVYEESSWRQFHADTETHIPITVIDLSKVTEPSAIITQTATEVQASLNLSQGPLMRVVLFDLGTDRSGRLLIVIHHLIIDGVSWRILLEDLLNLYEGLKLPAKTTSYQQWALKLENYAQSKELEQELDYWLRLPWHKTRPLPVDFANGLNNQASAGTLTVSLSASETAILLQEAPKVYHTQINDLLLTGLAQAFVGWLKESVLLIDLEGHGREDIVDGIDLSRTVGWFTSTFPVLLKLINNSSSWDVLNAIKEQLHSIPKRGIGYGLLRYFNKAETVLQLKALPKPQISFNYLGQFDQVLSSSAIFTPARESIGHYNSPQAKRPYLLDIIGSVSGGELQIAWTYSENVHQRATIERLAESFLTALRTLIAQCQTPVVSDYTPLKFPLAKLDQQELSNLIEKVDFNS
ncbi:MAG: amino acid adenylation domain-containing protein [Acidobacteriota bacterium]